MFNPVLWAREFLDWHCLDPDGEVWKRKTEEGSLGSLPKYDPIKAKEGNSIFNRPYQFEMLSCSSKRKISKCGRQIGKTDSLCIIILFHIFTNKNFHVEVIAPYQSQVDIIFKRINELISNNIDLTNSIKRNVKAPQYTLELKNGSQVIGFTAGTRSKQDAGSSRGQSCNMIIFDEADMLSRQDIDAALAVIINHPDALVWMSSTPTGKRDKFYESAQNPQYREFHFPSQVNPNWSQELEDYFKSELTIDGYNHEILAVWGEQEEGVYQLKYIEAAQEDFEYHKITPNPLWTYSIGVDWNDIKIGTTIAVIGFNPNENMFYVVDKHIISRAEKTQLTACNKIVEINRLWNPFAIYIDSGYGSVQYEILHDFGQKSIASKGPNHPDSKLRTIVKQYDFGSSIEIKDPFTKQPVKKPAKPFLVDNSVRRFESLQVKYPKSDTDFTKQLQNYIIDRVSITGRPVYKAQIETVGDHFLDAVNLGLVSFTLEKSIFGQTIYSSKIAIVNKLGENSFDSGTLVDEANKHKPKLGRTDGITKDSKALKHINGSVPAFNAKHETKIWAFDGFFRDEPPPSRKSTKYSIFTAKGKIRPSRSKF